MDRDVAVVLSGGAVNGVLMELGFLKRLRESELWQRVGWIYGTSSGGLTGPMAALAPLAGPHDARLRETVRAGIGDPVELARDLAAAPIEVCVATTDVSPDAVGP